LSTAGRKGALQDRLFDHYGLVVTDHEDGDADEDGVSVSGSSNYQEAVQPSSSRFTLRDIQDSVSSFSGSEQEDVCLNSMTLKLPWAGKLICRNSFMKSNF